MKNKFKKINKFLDELGIEGRLVFIIPKKGDEVGISTNLCSYDLATLSKDIKEVSTEAKKKEAKKVKK